ncbi:MAG: hypothetical protein KDA37_08570, partial [Planctomycetales bacterium]|nr:hypothetical protein [Planctomycetales bacterium]
MADVELLTEPVEQRTGSEQQRLDELLSRIHQLTSSDGPTPGITAAAPKPLAPKPAEEAPISQPESHENEWRPLEPASFNAAGLTESEIEGLVLKLLTSRSEATGRFIAENVRLPFRLIDPLLQTMKQDRL